MSLHETLLHYAILGLPVGLLTGMALSLVARHDGGWGGYGSFRRRAARLGHISTLMLPLLAGFYALALGALGTHAGWAAWGTWLWIVGGCTLPLALFAAAWRRRLLWVLPAPATALTVSAVCFALSVFLEM